MQLETHFLLHGLLRLLQPPHCPYHLLPPFLHTLLQFHQLCRWTSGKTGQSSLSTVLLPAYLLSIPVAEEDGKVSGKFGPGFFRELQSSHCLQVTPSGHLRGQVIGRLLPLVPLIRQAGWRGSGRERGS